VLFQVILFLLFLLIKLFFMKEKFGYTDEDIHGQVALQLRRRGFDAISAPEAGNMGISDEEQLTMENFPLFFFLIKLFLLGKEKVWFAIQDRRAILSFNRRDFCRMHTEYLISDRKHCGIIVSPQLPIGEVVKRCLRLLSALTAEEMVNRLEFLSSWR
jgi:hypothetical protein